MADYRICASVMDFIDYGKPTVFAVQFCIVPENWQPPPPKFSGGIVEKEPLHTPDSLCQWLQAQLDQRQP